MRLCRSGAWNSFDRDTWLEEYPTAQPLWARYYDLERCEPFVCDRDGVPRRRLDQIGSERRNGYAWYSDNPRSLFAEYERWATKNDPQNRVPASLTTKGANENGTIEMYRRPSKNLADFDAIVEPGGKIQDAIEKAPEQGDSRAIIWLANNLNQSEEAPAFHAVTARWTFNEQWDPEAKIRELWHVLGY